MSNTPTKLAMLATLYFSQGLPFGFFTQALPIFLRKQGISLEAIGLTSLLAIPWALKFLWAPVVDGLGRGKPNPRKRWILPLQITAALTMALTALVHPSTHLPWLLGLILFANLLAATQDIATDGLAVDTLSYEERGLGNGVQVAGYRVGMIIGGGALLILFDTLGWPATFLTLAGLLLLATIPILLHKETSATPPPAPAKPQGKKIDLGALLSFLRQPGIAPWIAIIIMFKLGEAIAGGMLRPFLADLQLSIADIGWLLGTGGFTAGLIGALTGGWLTQRLGRKRALLGFGFIQGLGVAAYLIPATGLSTSLTTLYIACMVEHFTGGLATVALFTLMMDMCREDDAATDYTLQASIVVMTSGVGAAVSGFVAGSIGYLGTFALSAGMTLGAIPLIAWILPRAMAQRERNASSRA